MDSGIFGEISLILAIATVIAGIIHVLRQPLIIGYIFTGLVIGPPILNLIKITETIEIFSHIGISLLLFIIGLGLNPRVIREVGKISLITGLGQIVFTSGIGYVIGLALGFGNMESLYIAVALTFSSTIIILKLLSDKKELSRLHGKIATGFLLVQDIVAVLILIGVASFSTGGDISVILTQTLLKGLAFVMAVSLLSILILPKLNKFFARGQEFLFLFAIGWGFGLASIAVKLGFSVEIGALIAGVSLAGLPYSYEISSRMRPLRDFFIIMFFIVLGAGMEVNDIMANLVPALIFSAFILIGNPLIVLTLMGILGYTKETSFKAGLTVAQISEFSLVLVNLGLTVGHVSSSVVAMVTLVGLITIAASTYFILYDEHLFKFLSPFLNVFERKKINKEQSLGTIYDVILFGYKGGSGKLIDTIKRLKKKLIVIDFDPDTIEILTTKGINCRYGDANDAEFLEELGLGSSKLVISSITDFATNMVILNHVRSQNSKAIVILMAKSDKIADALELYENGADYVTMPYYIGNERLSSIFKRNGLEKSKIITLKENHLKYLLQEA